MIIDGMMHLEVFGTYWEGLIDEVIEHYDYTGIDKGVALTTWTESRASNDRTLGACQKHPDRFIPFGHVRPIDPWEEELKRITQEFGTEFAALQDLERGVSKVYQETDVLGIDATRSGFEELAQFFNESVMKADMGIVDVYWMRKVEVSKRIGALNKERQELENELKRRFEAIDAKLED